MSAELIAILTIGATLAGGQLATVLWLTARTDESVGSARRAPVRAAGGPARRR